MSAFLSEMYHPFLLSVCVNYYVLKNVVHEPQTCRLKNILANWKPSYRWTFYSTSNWWLSCRLWCFVCWSEFHSWPCRANVLRRKTLRRKNLPKITIISTFTLSSHRSSDIVFIVIVIVIISFDILTSSLSDSV